MKELLKNCKEEKKEILKYLKSHKHMLKKLKEIYVDFVKKRKLKMKICTLKAPARTYVVYTIIKSADGNSYLKLNMSSCKSLKIEGNTIWFNEFKLNI